jgi:uncharacterized RDD family membrane protein YckC
VRTSRTSQQYLREIAWHVAGSVTPTRGMLTVSQDSNTTLAPVSPDSPAAEPALATWGLRAGGALVDVAIAIVLLNVAALADPTTPGPVALTITLAFGWATGRTGKTPGRLLFGTKVVREADRQVLGPNSGIGRSLLHVLDGLSLGLGYLWPLWDKKKQTFADKVIHSVVIKTR